MLDIPIRETRPSGLHLPRVTREDIVRSLRGIRAPKIDIATFERPMFNLPEAVTDLQWPTIDFSSADVGKAIQGVAAAAHLTPRRQRPRWPLAVGGLIVAGLAGWVLLSNVALRGRVVRQVQATRERIAGQLTGRLGPAELEHGDPVAFPAAATAPLEAGPFVDRPTNATDYPAGLGSNNGDGIRTLDDIVSRA